MKPTTVSLFCGAGGESVGKHLAFEELGINAREITAHAINHWDLAVATHGLNLPAVLVHQEDIARVTARTYGLKHIDLLWASPSCIHHSRARSGKPREEQQRSHAWEVVDRWLRLATVDVMLVENVQEFCFPTDTAVLSKRGVLPIGDLRVGDEVWTHNARWKPVTAISRKTSDTVRVDGYGNTISEATPNHQFYARQYAPKITKSGKFGRHEARLLEPEWIRADRLADKDGASTYTQTYSGYAWASPTELPRYWMRMPERLEVDVTAPAFFYMIGRWLGDGWIRKRKTRQNVVRICANLTEADELAEKLAATGLTWHRGPHGTVEVFDLAAKSSCVLIPWLVRHFGQFASGKTLPAWVFGASKQQRWALIEGYCDSDGHQQSNGQVSTTSVSRCLAVGIRLLLHSLGVAASISKTDARDLPYVGDPSRTMHCQTAYHVDWRIENQWLKGHRSDLHIWGRVRSVTPARTNTEVVDITVADDHSFIADGQVVHNCDWGPLDEVGQPIKARKGEDFRRFVEALRAIGYKVEWRILCAADYGDPTTRKRFFLQAARDGHRIVWPDPSHRDPRKSARPGEEGLPSWVAAATCIDWALPCPSIFERKRPLADATMRRIATGVVRYVLSGKPFLVTCNHSDPSFRGQGVDQPIGTITAAHDARGLVVPMVRPFVVNMRGTEPSHVANAASSLGDPLRTVSAGGTHHALVAPCLVQTSYGERKGQAPRVLDLHQPLGTVVAGGQKHGLVAAFLSRYFGGPRPVVGRDVREPMPTVTAHDHNSMVQVDLGEQPADHSKQVAAFILKYYGHGSAQTPADPMHTIRTIAHLGLVQVEIEGTSYVVTDIGLRMLEPRELALAMGFPAWYRWESIAGKPLTKRDAVRMIGNACPVGTVKALIKAVILQRPEAYGLSEVA